MVCCLQRFLLCSFGYLYHCLGFSMKSSDFYQCQLCQKYKSTNVFVSKDLDFLFLLPFRKRHLEEYNRQRVSLELINKLDNIHKS